MTDSTFPKTAKNTGIHDLMFGLRNPGLKNPAFSPRFPHPDKPFILSFAVLDRHGFSKTEPESDKNDREGSRRKTTDVFEAKIFRCRKKTDMFETNDNFNLPNYLTIPQCDDVHRETCFLLRRLKW